MEEQELNRAKKLGALIAEARAHDGRTVEDCAAILGLSPPQFRDAENGNYVVSLPQLEVLAIYLDVPMAHFWGTYTLPEAERRDYGALLALRHKIVGGLLRQARLDAGRSVEEVAAEIAVSPEQIEAYEIGGEQIPYLHLEKLAGYLAVPMDYFVDDDRGPLGRHEAQQRLMQRFRELPPEMRAFVAQPVNMPYLKTARRLSEMDAERLREIAASLLEITY